MDSRELFRFLGTRLEIIWGHFGPWTKGVEINLRSDREMV